eukprot:5252811-Pleurochrysis_carterae.AAC.1
MHTHALACTHAYMRARPHALTHPRTQSDQPLRVRRAFEAQMAPFRCPPPSPPRHSRTSSLPSEMTGCSMPEPTDRLHTF